MTFACRCFGTISLEEGWEEWVLLLPPRARTWGASFWSCLLVITAVLVLHHAVLWLAQWFPMYSRVYCAVACPSGCKTINASINFALGQ